MSMSSRGPTELKDEEVAETTQKLHETTLEGSDNKPVVASTSAVEEVAPEITEKEEVTAEATPAADETTPEATPPAADTAPAPTATLDEAEKAATPDAEPEHTVTVDGPAATSSASSSFSLFSSRAPSPVPAAVVAAPDSPRP
jgi:hypothetical protein